MKNIRVLTHTLFFGLALSTGSISVHAEEGKSSSTLSSDDAKLIEQNRQRAKLNNEATEAQAQNYVNQAADFIGAKSFLQKRLADYRYAKYSQDTLKTIQLSSEAALDFQAFQVAQNARIIQQNNEIIALLKQLASKK